MLLTLMPCSRNSAETLSVNRMTAAFDALYAATSAARQQAELEAKAARADELAEQLAEAEAKLAQAGKSAPQPAKRLPGRTQEPDNPATPPRARIVVGTQFDGAKAIDMLHGYTMLSGLKGFTGVSEQYGNALADKLVFSKIRAALGGRVYTTALAALALAECR